MKRLLSLIALACVTMLVLASVVFAFNGPPTDDSWVDESANNYDGEMLKLFASSVSGCEPSSTAYLKFDISSIGDEPVADKTIDTANLSLTVNSASFSQQVTVSLLEVTDDSWEETTITGSNAPGAGSSLSTLTLDAPPTAGTTLTFPSTQALVDYLNNQSAFSEDSDPDNTEADDNLASFALQITDCSTGAPRVDFRDSESDDPPILDLSNPNAITLYTFRASGDAFGPLIWVGLGLAAVLAVTAGLWGLRRRIKVR